MFDLHQLGLLGAFFNIQIFDFFPVYSGFESQLAYYRVLQFACLVLGLIEVPLQETVLFAR